MANPQAQNPSITVLGAGQMGLVCAALLTGSDRDPRESPPNVRIWGHDLDEVGHLAQTRASERLPGFRLPETVRPVINDAEALEGADLIVSAIPAQHTRQAWERLAPHVPAGAGAISVAKGVETRTLMTPTRVILEVAEGDRPAAVLSGPTIATELARCLPATMIAASADNAFSQTVQRLFSTSWLRVYTNADVLGVELAGATKNVIAIAAGILDGLGAGNNAKSALLARGLAEIARLGSSLGAQTDTFFGIAGVGDLATTCFSPEGRNRSCGEALGKGVPLKTYLEESPMVVEGVETTRAVVDLAQTAGVDMPITHAVHDVLFEGLDPIEAISSLMSRELRAERVG
ncbi:MAG: NAD(P)H-dependent glycerol-3-phosphate dehydrogenase [Planctomycetota bacterium]